MSFTAAVIQMRSSVDVTENIDAMDALVRKAAHDGAAYVQTPEMTGLVQQARKEFFQSIQSEGEDPLVAHAAELAKELGIHLHIGSTPILVQKDRAANRALVFNPEGRLIARYDKIHMFDVDLDNGESWRESAVYQPGESAVVFDMSATKVGLTICYDVRFPHLHDAYARSGVSVLTGPSCFTRQTGKAHWHTLLCSRAIETGCYMIAAAQGGDHQDGRSTYGHSLIANPWGEVIAEVSGEDPGYAIAEIDPSQSEKARAKVPNLANRRGFAAP